MTVKIMKDREEVKFDKPRWCGFEDGHNGGENYEEEKFDKPRWCGCQGCGVAGAPQNHHFCSFLLKIESEHQYQFWSKIWFLNYLEFGSANQVETLQSVRGP